MTCLAHLAVPLVLRQLISRYPKEGSLTLRGQVLRVESKTPVQGVHVKGVGLNRGTLTDSLGALVIEGIPVGKYTIRASRIGYAPAEHTDVPLRQMRC